MNDAQLRDAAVAELKKTTVGYINKKWKIPPAGSQWKKGLDLLAQIGAVVPPPPPPPTGALRRFDKLLNANFTAIRNKYQPLGSWLSPESTGGTPWPNGGGAFDISTPHGSGIKYRVTSAMGTGWAASRTSVGVYQNMPSWVGKSLQWDGHFYFPSQGNPTGFGTSWYPGSTLWEIGGTEGGTWGNTIGCTLVMMSDGKVAFNIRKSDTQFPQFPYPTPSPVALDTWHPIRWQVKWTTDGSGFHRGWIDGVQLMSYTGPTLFTSETIWETMTGFYSTLDQALNEVWYADLKITEMA